MRLFLSAFCFLFLSLSCMAQDQEMNVEVEKFFLQSYSPKGTLEWKLKGDESRQLSAFELDLKRLKMTLFGVGGKTKLDTPHCLFDKKNSLGGSRSNVVVISPQSRMTGKGYDFNLKTKTIFIRSNVKVVWALKSAAKGKKK